MPGPEQMARTTIRVRMVTHTPEAPRSSGRGTKPFFIPAQPITTYPRRQLIDVLRWVSSEGLMRTDEELLKETADALGYKRKGARIDAVLT